MRVTLIDRNNHHLFQPLLYQVATAGLSAADIAYPIRSVLTNQKNAETVMAEVTGVDTAQKLVWMHDLSLPYDYLILATGATDNYFGHDEWEAHAPGLKTIMQATDIRRHILLAFEAAELETEFQCPTNQQDLELDVARRKSYLTFVLVGGGPTGVEMAGAIAELSRVALAADFRHIDPTSTRIILVDAGPRILAAFPEELARKALLELERKGVEVHSHAKVEMVDAEGVIVNGERIYSKNVIWAAGVKASPAAKWLGVEADRARTREGESRPLRSRPAGGVRDRRYGPCGEQRQAAARRGAGGHSVRRLCHQSDQGAHRRQAGARALLLFRQRQSGDGRALFRHSGLERHPFERLHRLAGLARACM